MLKLEHLLAFVTAAEANSITEAARRLQISKSVASERAELERNIGATLMHRSTRRLALTEDGTAFLARAKRILREASDATAEVAERRGELTGPLRISAPVSFGILHLGPALNSFLKKHPRIDLSVELDDRFVGAADGFDAVIRHGPLPDNRWIAKRFGTSRRMLVASPEYLKRNGTPRTVAAQRRFDARDGTHDRGRVGVTIAIGVFRQEAATAFRGHERGMDGIVVCLVRQPGQYQRQWVVGHGSTKQDRLNSTTANGAIRPSRNALEIPTASATARGAQSILAPASFTIELHFWV